jgi:hypothetical protein
MNSAFDHIKGVVVIVVFLLLASSCEQIITLNLQENKPNVVIESHITNGRGPFTVRLSQSQDYFNQSDFVGIPKAQVQIRDSLYTETLVDKGSGYYVTRNIRGTPGHTFHLNVNNAGKEYSASVKLPPPVKIDTVYFGPSLFEKDSLNAFIQFHDPGGVANFYRIKLYRNNRLAINDYSLFTDAFSDGLTLWTPIYNREFAPGDSVVVELENLEQNSWKYLKGVGEIIQQGVNVQAPGNPPSNISGGALGYFGAWGTSIYKVVINK